MWFYGFVIDIGVYGCRELYIGIVNIFIECEICGDILVGRVVVYVRVSGRSRVINWRVFKMEFLRDYVEIRVGYIGGEF